KAESEALTTGQNGLGFANSLPGASQAPQAFTAESFMVSVANNLKSSPQNATDEYGVAVLPPPRIAADLPVGSLGSNQTPYHVRRYLPPKVVRQLTLGRLKRPLSFARMPFPTAGDSETTGLLYAARLTNGYQLYYFFPLTQVQIELGQVLRTLVL